MKRIAYYLATPLSVAVLLIAGCSSPIAAMKARQQQQHQQQVQNKKAANANVMLAMMYLRRGEIPQAKQKLLLAQRESPQDPAAWYGMGYFLETIGDVPMADEAYMQSVKLAPHDGAVQNNYGTFLCRHGRYEKAIQHFVLAAKDPAYLDMAQAYENAGMCALKTKNSQLARRYFNKALTIDASLPRSWFEVAKLDYSAGRYPAAKLALSRYHQFGKPIAETLYWGYLIGQKTNDVALVTRSRSALLSQFPLSQQAQRVKGTF